MFKSERDWIKIYTGMRVKMPVNGSFPDYVFDKSYKLKPLSEVEQYIKTNHHLEGIPSAKVVETEGMDVAAMNIKLLKKVEELTLYMIQLKKENDIMKEKSKEMQDEINKLKKK